jgi:hypothetical protein
MPKRLVAFILTLFSLSLVLGWAIQQRDGFGNKPEEVVWKMVNGSRKGDVETYLDCFTGAIRNRLDATAGEMTRKGFSEYLKERGSELKGVAVYDVKRTGERQSSLTIEYIYQDQTERQGLILLLEKGTWRIIETEISRRSRPLIPYGEPIEKL